MSKITARIAAVGATVVTTAFLLAPHADAAVRYLPPLVRY